AQPYLRRQGGDALLPGNYVRLHGRSGTVTARALQSRRGYRMSMDAEPTQRGRALAHASTIARFTLLEALRTRLPWIWAAVLAVFGAASLFINQIAITESARLQWSFYASGLRLAAVLTLAAYITSSMVRELGEKGMEM